MGSEKGGEGERDREEERRRNGWRELGMRHLINSVTEWGRRE